MCQDQYDRIFMAIERGQFKKGMTEEEIIDLVGEPQKKVMSSWIYTSHGMVANNLIDLGTAGSQRELRLFFRRGKLIEAMKGWKNVLSK